MIRVKFVSKLNYDVIQQVLDGKYSMTKSDITSFMIGKAIIRTPEQDYFIKELNGEKIINLYPDDYLNSWELYYQLISRRVNCAKSFAIIQADNRFFEVTELINEQNIFNNGNHFNWEQLTETYQIILQRIEKVIEYNNNHRIITLGLETPIWNFALNGQLFDFSPPRFMLYLNPNIFAGEEGEDNYERTFYRNFTVEGMKVNSLYSVLLAIKRKQIIVDDLPINWQNQLVETLLISMEKTDQQKAAEIKDYFASDQEVKFPFTKHPLEIIKKELKNTNQ